MDVCEGMLASTGVELGGGLIVAIALVAVGAMLLRGRRRRRGRAGVAAIVAVGLVLGASSALSSPTTAVAARAADCAGTGGSASAPPESPVVPPVAAPTGSVTGTLTRDGEQLVVTSPPGPYTTAPGTDWQLPTFAPDAGPVVGGQVELVGAGPDAVFETVDDMVVSSTITDAAGGYTFASVPDGDWTVRAALPIPDRTFADLWTTLPTNGCDYFYEVTPWSWLAPAVGLVRSASVTGGAATTGVDFAALNIGSSQGRCV